MSTQEYKIKDIEKVVQIKGPIKNVKITRLTAPGENYLSLVFRVDVQTDENGQINNKSLVAKCIPPQNKDFLGINMISMRNEIEWYIDIVPLWDEYFEEYGITESIFPKYYGSRIDNSDNGRPDMDCVLVLENLNPLGYKNEDRYIGFDLNTTKAVLKRISLFHAAPLGMKFVKPEKFKLLKDYIDSCRMADKAFPEEPPPHDESESPSVTPESALIEAIKNIPECAEYVPKLVPFLSKIVTPADWNIEGEEPWSTISHNDCWVNNIMIRVKDGEETLVKLVDFQMCGYKSFASDLVFFLLTSVRNEVLTEHFDELIRYYYDEFVNYLEKFQVNLKLSYEEYLLELKNAAQTSEITHALIFSSIVFGEKGTGVDIAVEEFNPFIHLTKMIQNMSDKQKRKIITIATETTKRNWI
ncbi:uncharacterized protein LOC115890908 [Sitophilus oryzae]|uniref:Uncharacterized protein LOC115890908 n=1 Tax=Sitophilus oryzae TaxID=7048 RepID=A0A6J2YVB2_SITOR|nr:uncharacterized protein LOC115890908 [Sitophilus oryzae]XP_030767128.1 uncharacterized protein LOC115890908 [Sitophilus oryzae]XP_030767129.1 uncharacterized protein LOC115890908 [Sitophilus oryzae]XP_030767130.1 uncharacterized protein LOC115890908 [Sitophilus oryzae]XP_030767131.1 uncharacterized protein LOC115890908 [Sitophilus oryzae]